MHCSGTSDEEIRCRFCGERYPDWRDIISKNQNTFFEVTVSDVTKRFPNRMTIEAFRRKLREEFSIPRRATMDISFDLPVSDTGRRVQLDGWAKYETVMTMCGNSGNV